MAEDDMPRVDDTQLGHGPGEYPFSQDLNPDFLAGENYGDQGPHPEQTAKTAFDIKGAHRRLQNIGDADLKTIPIMPAGSRLEQGAVYIDLRESEPREFKALGNQEAGANNWYVPKHNVPYWIWNQLIGVDNAERLDDADDSSTGPAQQGESDPYKVAERTQQEFVVPGASGGQSASSRSSSSNSRQPVSAGAAGTSGSGMTSAGVSAHTGGLPGGQTGNTETPDTGVSGWPNPNEGAQHDPMIDADPLGVYISDSADPEHDPYGNDSEPGKVNHPEGQ